jgi:hypothetical protein
MSKELGKNFEKIPICYRIIEANEISPKFLVLYLVNLAIKIGFKLKIYFLKR